MSDVEKVQQRLLAICILNFKYITSIKVSKYILQDTIFLFLFLSIGFLLMTDQVIFDIRSVVDKACIYTMNGE